MINEWAETTVPGLYAAGEVSGNIHGANRTSGNALAETQVFGRRAGLRSAEYALSVDSPSFHHNEVKNEIKFIQSFLEEHPQAYRPIDLKRRVKSIMHENVHYKRDSLGLQYALESLQTLQDEIVPKVRAGGSPANYNYEWEEAIESLFMVQLAQIVAASALAREESRGHHWRTDFPKMRSKWEKHTIARKTGVDSYQITDAPVVRVKDRTKERREPDPHLIAAGLIE